MTGTLDTLAAIATAAMVRDDRDQEALLDRACEEAQRPPRTARDATQTPNIARWYANRGLPVFPLEPGGKRPLKGSRGFHDATTDHEIMIGHMDGFWRPPNVSNIGIPTGDPFDVIDIDGPDGCATFIDMLGDGGWLNVRGITQTPRGLHLWVDADPNARNYSYPGDTGIDYRGKGGYVVVPPSHVHGTLYRWLVPPVQ